MNNFLQKGDFLTFIAPAGGVVSGTPTVIGSLVVVPVFSAAAGYDCEGATQGVFSLPKASVDTPAQFDLAYWDEAAGNVTTVSTANTLIGVFMDALAGGTVVADVRLNGVSI